MSGSIGDIPLIICRGCGQMYHADDRMLRNPTQCPYCGRETTAARPENEE